jgi:hypothetical protein
VPPVAVSQQSWPTTKGLSWTSSEKTIIRDCEDLNDALSTVDNHQSVVVEVRISVTASVAAAVDYRVKKQQLH